MRELFRAAGLALSLGLGGAGMAAAQGQSQTLFSHRAWEVQGVVFDNGKMLCVAQVYDGNAAFSIWADGVGPVRLQFYSPGWTLGEGSADLVLQIDRRSPWNLSNAELYENSVFFNLPNSDAGIRFLTEVAQGMTLYLRNEAGRSVHSYTLSGSNASIRALTRCVDALPTDDGDGNPFN